MSKRKQKTTGPAAPDTTICQRGVRVSSCLSAQPAVIDLGGTPFYCDDCNAETHLPALLIDLHKAGRINDADSLLATMGLTQIREPRAATSSLTGGTETATGRCVYSKLPVHSPCTDKGCPSYIRAVGFENCAQVLRANTARAGQSLTTGQAAIALGVDVRVVDLKIADIRSRLQATLAAAAVGKTTVASSKVAWIVDLEVKYETDVVSLIELIGVEKLCKANRLNVDQRQHLLEIHENQLNSRSR